MSDSERFDQMSERYRRGAADERARWEESLKALSVERIERLNRSMNHAFVIGLFLGLWAGVAFTWICVCVFCRR